jgi:predicted Zn-dependent peptidase
MKPAEPPPCPSRRRPVSVLQKRARTLVAGAALASLTVLAAASALGAVGQTPATKPAEVRVPFEKYALKNGMTVILHEDHSLPLVAVNLMFKVGSRFEDPGRTGFAHLFEHLMFMGTRRAPTKMFDLWMEAEGGSNNAWTSSDRTAYHEVGPTHILPLLLWLEADRLSSLAADMTEVKLNAQREVVRNERRQTSENTPYGKVELRLPELLYPKGHPYHHPVIGSHEDLQAASVEDVKSFFHRWYVPNNASLVIAGDFNSAAIRKTVDGYFGSIPAATAPKAPAATDARLSRIVRETIPDDVELPKVVMAWHSAAQYAPGDADLDLVALILESGKASRLYKALVYDTPLAQEVTASQNACDLGSYFTIEAIARQGVSLEKLEAAIDAQVAKLTQQAVADGELRRAKSQYEMAFVARIESLAARASMLNRYESNVGDPDFAEKDLGRYRQATAASLLSHAKATFNPQARVILHVVPKEQATKSEGAGR